MLKVLNIWKANPTAANARKVRAYERSHPMAICMLTREDSDFVASAIYQANNE